MRGRGPPGRGPTTDTARRADDDPSFERTIIVKDPAPPCWARVRDDDAGDDPCDDAHVPDGGPAPLWRHAETRDTWRGALAHGRPDGRGIYNFHLTKLCLGGTVRARVREGGPRGAQDDVVFAGPASASWPDGARYEGELALSKMHGRGRYVWPNGDVYDGEWRAGRRHGAGTLCSWSADSALLRVEALGPGRRAYALRYCGAWEDNVFAGQGVMEFFDAPPGAARAAAVHDDSCDPPFSGASTCSKTRRLPAGRELLRRFEGLFRAGFPARGRLETRAGGAPGGPPGGLRETFEQVHFDGATCAGSFATWYWAPAEAAAGAQEGPEPAQSRGGALEALAEHGEERAAVASRFLASMRAVRGVRIDAVQRVRNNDLRAIFELQRRALQRKVTAPPRSLPWNPRTMEAWAFHAPGRSSAPPGAARAAPWESIVEEGFQATLAGSDNGRVFGAGVYFAHDALLSHRYALQSAKAVGPSGAPDPGPLRMFLSRIVTGISTVGSASMNIPPLDPAGAKGEHFHSLVDNAARPRVFVIQDNTRAFPGYLVTYSDACARALPSAAPPPPKKDHHQGPQRGPRPPRLAAPEQELANPAAGDDGAFASSAQGGGSRKRKRPADSSQHEVVVISDDDAA